MASTKTSAEGIFQGVLVNYLVSQARTVEASVNRALWALLERNERLASEVFLTEPRINEMEILIDEHAIRMLRQGEMLDTDVRLIVATLKINNDLERMGDLAVNLGERAISLSQMGEVHIPVELEPMTTAVRAMVSKCLGALIYQNVDLATQVLESDDVVDQYRDQVFEALLAGMTANPALAAPNLHYVLASRHLERIADHATNIAEDILFWVRGLEVRHGRAKQMELNAEGAGACRRIGRRVIDISQPGHLRFNFATYDGHVSQGFRGAVAPRLRSIPSKRRTRVQRSQVPALLHLAPEAAHLVPTTREARLDYTPGAAPPLFRNTRAYFTPNSRRCNTSVTLQSKNGTQEIP